MNNTLWWIDKKNSTNESFFERIKKFEIETNLEFQFYFKIEFVEAIISKKYVFQQYEDVWDATVEFEQDDGLTCSHVDEIVLLVMLLLSEYAYRFEFESGKFGIVYTITNPEKNKHDFTYTICDAIGLSQSANGIDVPDRRVFNAIYKGVSEQEEKYQLLLIGKIRIRFYLKKHKEKAYKLSSIEIKKLLFKEIHLSPECVEQLFVPSMACKPPLPDFITALKNQRKKSQRPS